ncbi:MAG: serpin family protein [Planctomycetota bacterium]
MKTALSVLLVLLLTGFAAAKKAPAPDPKPAAVANNAFAADLYGVLAEKKGNLFFSPYSVTAALAMTREGSKGATRAEIDKVFHWTDAITAKSHRALVDALKPGTVTDGYGDEAKEVPAYALEIANALWAQQGLAVEKPFSTTLADDFGAPLRRLDFTKTAAARKVINDWVAKQTKDRIQDIVPPDLPTPDTLFALANAIWFKGAWDEPFKEHWTKDIPFTAPGEEIFEVSMMHRTGGYRYVEDDAVQVVEIPYRGGHTSMVVVLPKKTDGLAAVEKTLTGKKLQAWIAALRRRSVSLKFPKFEITCPTDLTDVLPKMGMPAAFDSEKADFTGMTAEKPLFIGAVLHKAFVKVNEAGTEAAAATVVMMTKGGAPRNPTEFTADHPFLFLIRHAKTGAILFAGRFVMPE